MNNLVTKRLHLIPFKQNLVQATIRGDGELAKVLGIKILPNSLDREEFNFRESLPGLSDILDKYPLQREWGWGSLVIHQADNTLIGHVMLKIIPDATGSPTGSLELGYFIIPSYRQQGYGTEATKAMLDWAFTQPEIDTMTAGCDADNIASQRLLEKIGMEHTETRGDILVWKLGNAYVPA